MTYHTNQVFLVAALTVAFSAVAVPPVPAIAQQAPSAFFPTGVVYQWFQNAPDRPSAEKLDIPGVDPKSHGTYRTFPYYAFVEDPATHKRYLVSDGRLKAELTLIPGSDGMRSSAADPTKHWPVAKYKMDFVRSSGALPHFTEATVSFNDPGCKDEACFWVSGTGPFAELPSSSDPFTIYTAREEETGQHLEGNYTMGQRLRTQAALRTVCTT